MSSPLKIGRIPYNLQTPTNEVRIQMRLLP